MNGNQLEFILNKQKPWSERTFGEGSKTQARIDHIRTEYVEHLTDPEDPIELVDIIILALDAAWRTGCTIPYICRAMGNSFHPLNLRCNNISDSVNYIEIYKNTEDNPHVPVSYWMFVVKQAVMALKKLPYGYSDDNIYYLVRGKQFVNMYERTWPAPIDADVMINHNRNIENRI